MIRKILNLRLKQFGRILKEIGAVYFILLFVVCFGFFLGMINSLVHSTSPWIGLLGVLMVSSLHFSRKDRLFLKKLKVNRPQLYIAEYLLMTLPLVIVFIGGANFGAIIVQIIGLVILAFIPNPEIAGKTFSNTLDFKFLSKYAFEARAYLRRFFIPGVTIYILGLLATQFVVVSIIAVLLIALSFSTFFDEVESKTLFEALHFKKGILNYKIRLYLGLYFILGVPYILLFLLLHLQYWYILLVVLFIGMTFILFNIFYKYAHYAPYRRKIYNSTVNGVFFAFMIFPFTYPVTLLYLIYYWRKARKNIQLYYA